MQGGALCWDTDVANPGTEECDIVIFSGRSELGAAGPGAIDAIVYYPWAVPGPLEGTPSADHTRYIYTQYDLESVLLHELGHALGLSHTSLAKSMMTPSIDLGELLTPSCDDKRALLFLYCDGVGEVSCDDDVVASYWCPDDERP